MSLRLRSIVVALLAGSWSCAPQPTTPAPTTPTPTTPTPTTPTPTTPTPTTPTSSTTNAAAEEPTQPAAALETTVPESKPLRTAHFSDGSGNRYTFQSESAESTGHLVYEPVTPKQSSSGTYSGGAPADVALSVEQNTELWRRLAALQANEAIAVTARGMGTGAFETTGPNGTVRFLIAMGPELSEFVAFVEQLRP